MGNKNLISTVRNNINSDGATATSPTTTCKIWAAPRLMPDGAPALGFYPHRFHGPVIQLVEATRYAQFYEDFLAPGGAYFADPSKINDALNKRDQIQSEIQDQGSTQARMIALQAAFDEIKSIKGDNKERSKAEALFAEENVREFIIMNHDGVTRIDYNENPEDWEVIIFGSFTIAQYCMVKPAPGAASFIAAMSPDGQGEDEVTAVQSSGGLIQAKIAKLRNVSTQSTSCPPNMVRSDGQNVPVDIKYPKDGDTWVGGMLQNLKKGRTKLFRALDRSSIYLEVDETGKLIIAGSQLEIKTDPRAIKIGDFVENPLQTIGPSNAVTPVERFRPRLSDLNFTAGAYNLVKSLMDDLDNIGDSDQSDQYSHEHEVIDFNDFVPSGVEVPTE